MNKPLSYEERIKIEVYLSEGKKPYIIAKLIGRCAQTIYNEIKRGSITQLDTHLREYTVYKADVGERIKHINLSQRGSDLKVGSCLSYIRRLEYLVKDLKLSPYAALQYVKIHNEDFPVSICTTTFYKYVEHGIFLNLSYKDLPNGYRKKATHNRQMRNSWKNTKGKSITERSLQANDRIEFGHFEGDTVQSCKGDNTCLLTLTDRMTRNEIIRKLPDKSSETVYKEFCKLKHELEESYKTDFIKSITFDNGVEFAQWKKIEELFDIKCYFAHPYCASERGSNENCNRIIRRFIPKGSRIGDISDMDIQKIEDWINNLPRRILNGMTSAMMMEQYYTSSIPS